MSRNWMADLRNLGTEKIIIRHRPMTMRYLEHATAAKEIILQRAVVIGFVELGLVNDYQVFEIVTWTEPINRGDFGWYAVFRIACHPRSLKSCEAVLFCFYNGKDTGSDKRKGFKSEEKARLFMKLNFQEYTEVKTK